jgi:hypothetical protein
LQTLAASAAIPVLPNFLAPGKTMVTPLLAGSYDAASGSLLATAGAPTQLLITPYDDYGNVANVTSLEAIKVTVVIEGAYQGRYLMSAGNDTVVQVDSSVFDYAQTAFCTK